MNQEITLQYADPLIQLTLQVWSRRKDDTVITSILTNLVQGMTKNAALLSKLEQGLLPTIVDLLNQGTERQSVSVIAYTLELLIVLSTAHPQTLPAYYVDTIFPYMMKELCRSTCPSIIQVILISLLRDALFTISCKSPFSNMHLYYSNSMDKTF